MALTEGLAAQSCADACCGYEAVRSAPEQVLVASPPWPAACDRAPDGPQDNRLLVAQRAQHVRRLLLYPTFEQGFGPVCAHIGHAH